MLGCSSIQLLPYCLDYDMCEFATATPSLSITVLSPADMERDAAMLLVRSLSYYVCLLYYCFAVSLFDETLLSGSGA
jgi:hypothetical protein